METKREWKTIKEYKEIMFEMYQGIAKITINRERYRNAFTPTTVTEMSDAFYICRERQDINVVVLTGAGDKAFCSGGDMHVKGRGGYVGTDGVPRLNILDVQKQIRSLPKPVIAMVNGYAIGGGHVLHVVCDLTIASENARFGQTGPRVGSFDAGLGSSYLARCVGQKRAREIWFLCRQYTAQEAYEMYLRGKKEKQLGPGSQTHSKEHIVLANNTTHSQPHPLRKQYLENRLNEIAYQERIQTMQDSFTTTMYGTKNYTEEKNNIINELNRNSAQERTSQPNKIPSSSKKENFTPSPYSLICTAIPSL